MTTNLTPDQREELHKAMLDYLLDAGFTKTFDQFKQEAPNMVISHTPDLHVNSRTSGLLVKKWTSVVRLQKKLLQTEARLAEVTEELSHFSHLRPGASSTSEQDWLPKLPAKRALVGHRDPITAVAFHPMYSVLATSSEDSTIKIWDWETGQVERTLRGHTRTVTDCEYDSKGKNLVSSSYDLLIKIWSADEGYANITTLAGHEHSVSSARFLPGDDQVVSSSRDQTIRIWDITSRHCIRTIRSHATWIRCALPSADGKLLLSCGDDHTARLIDAQTGASKLEMRGHDNVVEVAVFVPRNSVPAVAELAAIPTSRRPSGAGALEASFVVTSSRDKSIKIWDTISGQCISTLAGHSDWVRALAFHPGGKYLLSSSDDHCIKIWDLRSGRCVRTVEAHEKFVSCLAWGRMTSGGTQSQGGVGTTVNVLASGSVDKTIKVWVP